MQSWISVFPYPLLAEENLWVVQASTFVSGYEEGEKARKIVTLS
jgi:hypothetical protein